MRLGAKKPRYTPAQKVSAVMMLKDGATTCEIVWATKLSDKQVQAIANELIADGTIVPRKNRGYTVAKRREALN